MEAVLRAIEYHLPEHVLDNDRLAHEFDWPVGKIEAKTGIVETPHRRARRMRLGPGRNRSQRLFQTGVSPQDVDYLLFCTQSPDYPLRPPPACSSIASVFDDGRGA